jgi:hypothetical protein
LSNPRMTSDILPSLSGTSKLVSVPPKVLMVAFIPFALVRVKSWISVPSVALPNEAEVGMADALVPVAAESAGAELVVAAVSWLVVGLESQLASNRAVLMPVAKSVERWEMGMREGRKVKTYLLFAQICPLRSAIWKMEYGAVQP